MAEAGAREPRERGVEPGQEARAVLRRERLRAGRDLARAAQVAHQVAGGERHADRVLGERLAVRRDRLGARLHRACRERHVGGDHDVAALRAFGDVVVGLVHAGADHDALDEVRARHRDRRIRHDDDLQRRAAQHESLGHAIDLLLHRAGVGIDIEDDGPDMEEGLQERARDPLGAHAEERNGEANMRCRPGTPVSFEVSNRGPGSAVHHLRRVTAHRVRDTRSRRPRGRVATPYQRLASSSVGRRPSGVSWSTKSGRFWLSPCQQVVAGHAGLLRQRADGVGAERIGEIVGRDVLVVPRPIQDCAVRPWPERWRSCSTWPSPPLSTVPAAAPPSRPPRRHQVRHHRATKSAAGRMGAARHAAGLLTAAENAAEDVAEPAATRSAGSARRRVRRRVHLGPLSMPPRMSPRPPPPPSAVRVPGGSDCGGAPAGAPLPVMPLTAL